MTYEQFVYKLREYHAVKIHWDRHEIDIMLNNGFVCVESFPLAPLQVFHNLSVALDKWCYPEVSVTLGKIINNVDDINICSNPSFREVAFLDPNLLVEPTNLQRNSITGGVMYSDSSVERNVQAMIESMSACLYNVTLETKIYQTLEWRWLKEMLENKRILFRNPSDYHDAWENFMFRKYDWEGGADEGLGQLAEASKNFYCSCWSVCEESDGIWNNRSRGRSFEDNCPMQDDSKGSHNEDQSIDSQCLKIETTVGGLLCSLKLDKLFGGENIWKNFRAGRVKYFDEFELRTFKERTLHMMETRKDFRLQFCLSHLIVQSFFMKRKQFEYEQEIRLVLLDDGKLKSLERDNKGVYFPTEPCRWIHEVVVHPDCPDENYQDILKQLSAYGIDRVVKSPLTPRFWLK